MNLTKLRVSLAAACCLLGAQLATAADDIVIVSRQASSVTIPIASLLANDGQVGMSQLLPYPPSHGGLTSNGATLTYTPGLSFLTNGGDSFVYSTTDTSGEGGSNTATVHLVPDLRVTAHHVVTPESDPPWTVVNPAGISGLTLHPDGDPEQGSVSFDAQVQAPGAYLEFDPIGDPNGTVGGTMRVDIDGEICVDPCATPILRTIYPIGTAFELIYDGGYLHARAWQDDGSYVETAPVPFVLGHVEVTWWLAREAGSRDGGLVWQKNDELAGELVGVDNHSFGQSGTLVHQVGAIEPTANSSGLLRFFFTEVWTSDFPLRYQPQLSATAEVGLVTGFNGQFPASYFKVSQAAALTGLYGTEVKVEPAIDATLQHSCRGLESSMRVRFKVDPATVPAGATFDILSGGDPALTDAPFRIQVRTTEKLFEMRAIAIEDYETEQSTKWIALDPDGSEIELAWWAGSAVEGGGFNVAVDGVLVVPTIGLKNSSQRVSLVRFGAINVSGTSRSGVLYLDDMSIWY